MQIDRIRNFNLIESKLKLAFEDLFYRLPNGKEAMAPIKLLYLSGLLSPNTMYNPHLHDNTFIIKCLFHVNLFPDKNYDNYEILKNNKIWVLLHRLPDNLFSIVSVVETPGGIT